MVLWCTSETSFQLSYDARVLEIKKPRDGLTGVLYFPCCIRLIFWTAMQPDILEDHAFGTGAPSKSLLLRIAPKRYLCKADCLQKNMENKGCNSFSKSNDWSPKAATKYREKRSTNLSVEDVRTHLEIVEKILFLGDHEWSMV